MHCMMYLYPLSTAVLQKSIKTMPRLAVLYCISSTALSGVG